MSKVYLVHPDGRTESTQPLTCKNEDRELQRILEKNPDLLPGDQFDPEEPRRWLLVKREMPVPDPNTGAARWSMDFFFLDQDAIPTFVECKRFVDTRSRREVVGQVLEYAANGHHYWTKEHIRELATASAAKNEGVDSAIARLRPGDDLSSDAFFERAEKNLREGVVRIVFFLEQAPRELMSVVEFLNKQLTISEVFLVEARQYDIGGQRIVAPMVFGYTEQAHSLKRSSRESGRRQWDAPSFFDDAIRRLGQTEVDALRGLYDLAASLGLDISWGSGKDRGSFSLKDPSLCTQSLMTAYTNGTLALNFGWLNENSREEAIRDRLKELAAQRMGIEVPPDYVARWPGIRAADWVEKRGELAQVLRDLVREFRDSTN